MLKIDLSTIALILSLVVPGLVAKRSRRKLCPQSFESAGPATELGELVALSLSVHTFLLAFGSLSVLLFGLLKQHAPLFYFQAADQLNYQQWESCHKSAVVLCLAFYICLSVIVGYLLGILSGWLRLNHPFSRMVESSPFLTDASSRTRSVCPLRGATAFLRAL